MLPRGSAFCPSWLGKSGTSPRSSVFDREVFLTKPRFPCLIDSLAPQVWSGGSEEKAQGLQANALVQRSEALRVLLSGKHPSIHSCSRILLALAFLSHTAFFLCLFATHCQRLFLSSSRCLSCRGLDVEPIHIGTQKRGLGAGMEVKRTRIPLCAPSTSVSEHRRKPIIF